MMDDKEALRVVRADNARLRSGIEAFLSGNYFPRPSQRVACPHGIRGNAICEQCADAYFAGLLQTPEVTATERRALLQKRS